MTKKTEVRLRLTTACTIAWLAATTAQATPFYSIDWDSTQALANFVDEGDVLMPQGTGQFPSPAVALTMVSLGIAPTANGITEVDAISFGLEPQLTQNQFFHRWFFSVDQYALGLPGVPAPSVTTEGAGVVTRQQAAGDVYATSTTPGPLPVSNGINTGVFDGDGNLTPGFAAPGLNLREPCPPIVPQQNENLDGLDLEGPSTVNPFPVYFSLDSSFIDPTTGLANSGTAAANGFDGGDVLVTTSAGGPPTVYASAGIMGLNLNGTPNSDDLDALVLWENGDGIFQIPTAPYSWLGVNPTDMLLFSVRRGSNLIGTLDSLLGIPIAEGDILLPLALQVPGIFVPAQVLGLHARTPGITNDELDALDVQLVLSPPPLGIPEPGTFVLLASGCLVLCAAQRGRIRRSKQCAAAFVR